MTPKAVQSRMSSMSAPSHCPMLGLVIILTVLSVLLIILMLVSVVVDIAVAFCLVLSRY